MHEHHGTGWSPHGYCFLFDPVVLWFWLIGNGGIALVYVGIASVLWYMHRRLPQVLPARAALYFAPFIFSCGLGHALDIWTIWSADYLFQAIWGCCTLLASIPTLIGLIAVLPKLASIIDGSAAAERRAAEAVRRAEVLVQELHRRDSLSGVAK